GARTLPDLADRASADLEQAAPPPPPAVPPVPRRNGVERPVAPRARSAREAKRQTRVDAVSPARTVNKVKLLKAPPPTFSVKKNKVTQWGLPFDIVQAHALALKLAREASRKAFVEEAEQAPTMTLPRQVGLQAGGSGITLTRHPPAGAAQDDTRP